MIQALLQVKVTSRLGYLSGGADDVLAVDWRHDLGSFRQRVGDSKALQGNLDPTALFCAPDELRSRVQRLCAGAGRAGHIFNLGHGVLPQTDPESLRVVLDAARDA